MSFSNPTPVTIGMNGTFVGRHFRVVGRVVMGMELAGKTYYWNEFNLVGADGKSATLVHEITERGPEWRMFTLFEPRHPMSATEAALKQVGDTVNLNGKSLPVTLVDESRVYHLEGEAPEGVEVGDVARYFNAEAGDDMIVVSWTGDELEYYQGVDLPYRTVTKAFGLPEAAADFFLRLHTPRAAASTTAKQVIAGLLVVAAIIGGLLWLNRSPSPQAAPVKPKTPASPLVLGNTGQLNGTAYRIRGHAVVEIAQVGSLYDRHEYELDEDGSLLVYGSKPGASDWLFFTPFQPAAPLTPVQAAAKGAGEKVDLDDAPVVITELFLSTIRREETEGLTYRTNGTVLYGFVAQSGTNLFLARWNESGIAFYRGSRWPAGEVTRAFRSKTGS